jgi:hypothetical protein
MAGAESGDPITQLWPEVLDVNLRVELRYVEQLYCNTAPHLRAALWLQPNAAAESAEAEAESSRMSDFVQVTGLFDVTCSG